MPSSHHQSPDCICITYWVNEHSMGGSTSSPCMWGPHAWAWKNPASDSDYLLSSSATPTLQDTLETQTENGWTLACQTRLFPWILSDHLGCSFPLFILAMQLCCSYLRRQDCTRNGLLPSVSEGLTTQIQFSWTLINAGCYLSSAWKQSLDAKECSYCPNTVFSLLNQKFLPWTDSYVWLGVGGHMGWRRKLT